MSGQDYFQIYIQTISDALKRVRKIGFKKFNLVKDLVDTVQNFLAKQVYGRIEPANYLLALIVLLGSKTPKLYSPIISAIQRLFSYNFIAPNEDLSVSLKLLKQQHRQFLVLPQEDYSSKSFKEIYIETLVNLGEKDEGFNINVAKTLSLIWRLDQNSIPQTLLPKIFDYLLDSMVTNRLQQEQKLIKSVVLQIFRHSLQSYRQAHDRKFLNEDNNISLKNLVSKYGQLAADTVAIRLDIAPESQVEEFHLVPNQKELQHFRTEISKAKNQKGVPAGKFGWCINCRSSANYYCKANRLPVCSYPCKQSLMNQISSLEKFVVEEQRSLEMFQSHVLEMFTLFRKYLVHPDVKKRVCFSEIFVLMASQLKKIIDKLTPKMYFQLRKVVRHVMVNVYAETQAFLPCMATLKKLLQLRIFLEEIEVLLRLFAKKLVFFLTPPNIRDQILRFIRDLINNRLLFDAAMELDCSSEHYDSVREVIDALRQVYIGIHIPQTITIPPSQDLNAKRMCLQICLQLLKFLQETDKKMSHKQSQILVEKKSKLNKIRSNIERFNTTEKPLKIVKKLIEEGFLSKDPEQLAKFLHQNLKRLNLTNIGQLIGDIDQFAGQIRKHFIGKINFSRQPIDEGMRFLLKHFTLPGESQVVERIIETFGITFFNQNRDGTVFVNSDAVYSFSYLLMMLQSNLHNPQVVEKMTLPQYSKLSYGMNGSSDAEFPPAFLEEIYNSVQKKPLGVHQKLKQIQILIAYNTNPKKALEIHQKQSERDGLERAQSIQIGPIQELRHSHHYPLPIFIQEFICQIIDMLTFRIKDLEQREKQEIIKSLELIQGALRLSNEWNVPRIIERGIQKIWEEIQRTNIISKKYLLMEAMLEWVRKFQEMISEQWRVVIFLISRFNRSKSIRKDQSNKNHSPITIVENRCFLFDSYIEHVINKTTKLSNPNLINLLKALLGVSREQTNEGANHFCLEKINEVLELNSARNVEILNSFWGELRDYYIQLGKHKNEKVSLFASDFLKQMVTKFLKKKDLMSFQRQYLKPFQQIFNTSKSFAVKELMIGGLSYFVNNYPTHLKTGWKTILTVVNNCFQEEEHQVIKQKAYAILKKIYQSNFSIFNLQQNYTDVVQILNKLTRQKEQGYGLGCLQIIQFIVEYYHQRLGIDLQKSSQAVENSHVDINFWQTVFLPLLSIIFPMCGDSRVKVQAPAIKTLFDILTKYGKLFRYQFWKMVLQGVLRPAFEQITYTSQSKPLKKDELQKWLNNSFTQLFHSINDLIVLYYEDFQLFLQDVFKIYENCIINHSLILLIQLSFKALNNLLEKIAPNFQEHDWEVYLSFAQSLMKKTLPIQLSSLQAWIKSKDLLETNHQAKCFALQTFLNKIQIIFEKYPLGITEKIYLDVLKEIEPIYNFVFEFNSNIELRSALWKNGFYQQQKSLPGLIRHQYEILSFRSKIYFKLIQFDDKYLYIFFKHFFEVIQMMKDTISQNYTKEPTIKDIEREKFAMYYRKLINEVLLEQLLSLGSETIKKAKVEEKVLEECLSLMSKRIYCCRCSFCESCQNSAESWITMNSQLQQIILMLFKGK